MKLAAQSFTILTLLAVILLPPARSRLTDESRGDMPDMVSTLPSSGPVAASEIEQQIAEADLIAAGTITSVSEAEGDMMTVSPEARADADQLMLAQVRVLRTLAGEAPDGELRVLFLRGRLPSRPWLVFEDGQTLLLFLRQTPNGYVPVMVTGSGLETLPNLEPPRTTANRNQAVAHELDQLILHADTDSGIFSQAVSARSDVPAALDLDALDAATDDPVRRLAGVVVALARQQPEALQQLHDLGDTSALQTTELWIQLVRRISELRQPGSLSALTQLVRGRDATLAQAAVIALRQLHDRSAIPVLVEALNSANQETRYQAVMGLAELEPDVNGGPSWSVYQSDEQRYLRLWQQWWDASHTG